MEHERYEVRNGKFGSYLYDTVTEKDLPLKEVERLLNGLTECAKELCWYGHTLAGGVPIVGPARPAKEACDRWYDKTMRLLDALGHSAARQQDWSRGAVEAASRSGTGGNDG